MFGLDTLTISSYSFSGEVCGLMILLELVLLSCLVLQLVNHVLPLVSNTPQV